jgi:adenylyltransferase/sulfurtransferase
MLAAAQHAVITSQRRAACITYCHDINRGLLALKLDMSDSAPDRYSRQERFAPLGPAGQARLRAARVAIAGCGALGSYHAAALARAGVGFLRLIDRDYVEWSNLQRQWLYEEEDAREGYPKAAAAARRLAAINSEVVCEPAVADLTPETAPDLLGGVDLILDGTDNFETRYLMNDFAVEQAIPWIYGGAVASYGVVMPVLPGRTACFECVYPEPPQGAQPTCETAGVLNTITTLVGALQVSAAIKLLGGEAAEVAARITTADVWTGVIRQINMPPRDPACPACGTRACRHLHGAARIPISLCGRNAVQIHDRRRPLNLPDLAAKLGALGQVRSNEFALRFFADPYELTIFPDGRAIIKGTTDPGLARSLYSRYIGN